jgi:co-chaperonin GroES (HSP10)
METIEKSLISEKQIRKTRIPPGSSKVIVKINNRVVDEETDSGILKISEVDADWNKAMHSDRTGEVVAVPRGKLPFKFNEDIFPWETEVEISPGMTVIFDYMSGLNCDSYEDENGYEYKVLDYSDLYVAYFPREWPGEHPLQVSKDEGQYIIPLNGFHIFERVYKESRGKFDVFGQMRIDRTKGIVKYLAQNNTAYENGSDTDHLALRAGDEVEFGTVPEVCLEDEAHCHFDGGTMYRRAQARNIELIWRNGEMILPEGRCLIKQHKEEEVRPSGIILPSNDKLLKNHRGEIIISSIKGIPPGKTVKYIKGSGRVIKYKEEDHRILNSDQILYVE